MALDRYEVNKADYPLTQAHVQSLIDRVISWRGHARKQVKDHVAYNFFGKKVMKTLKTPEELNAYIEKLKNGGLHTKPGARRGTGYFQHPILQLCMDNILFRHHKDLGVLFVEKFRRPTAQLIGFFCATVQSLIETRTSNSGKNDSLDFEEQRKAYLTHNSGAAQWGIPLGIEERMLRKGDLEPDKPDEDELAELDAEMAEIDPSWEGPNEEDGEADPGEDKDGPHTPPPEQDEPDNRDQGQDNYDGEHPDDNQNVWDENGGGDDGAYGNGDRDDRAYDNGDRDDRTYDNGDRDDRTYDNGDRDDRAYDNGDYDNGNYGNGGADEQQDWHQDGMEQSNPAGGLGYPDEQEEEGEQQYTRVYQHQTLSSDYGDDYPQEVDPRTVPSEMEEEYGE
ncbi:hypothetical protein FRC11_014995 [Ceratobasidium sp. 423]|nr:hypothetical protein FRC11_014995 [Ceratobasidium sp. 423]